MSSVPGLFAFFTVSLLFLGVGAHWPAVSGSMHFCALGLCEFEVAEPTLNASLQTRTEHAQVDRPWRAGLRSALELQNIANTAGSLASRVSQLNRLVLTMVVLFAVVFGDFLVARLTRLGEEELAAGAISQLAETPLHVDSVWARRAGPVEKTAFGAEEDGEDEEEKADDSIL